MGKFLILGGIYALLFWFLFYSKKYYGKDRIICSVILLLSLGFWILYILGYSGISLNSLLIRLFNTEGQ